MLGTVYAALGERAGSNDDLWRSRRRLDTVCKNRIPTTSNSHTLAPPIPYAMISLLGASLPIKAVLPPSLSTACNRTWEVSTGRSTVIGCTTHLSSKQVYFLLDSYCPESMSLQQLFHSFCT